MQVQQENYEVWYRKEPSFRQEDIPTSIKDLRDRWSFVRNVKAHSLDTVYMMSQGEFWSPNGEAREVIRAAEVSHTSMSVGDIIRDPEGAFWVVGDGFGFNEVELKNDCRHWGENCPAENYCDVGCILGYAFCNPSRCKSYVRGGDST